MKALKPAPAWWRELAEAINDAFEADMGRPMDPQTCQLTARKIARLLEERGFRLMVKQ